MGLFICRNWEYVIGNIVLTVQKRTPFFFQRQASCRIFLKVSTKEFVVVYIILLKNILDLMKKINDCKPGTVFPLNQQCTSVCLCRDGISEVVQCPANLAYDIKSDKCLLPHLAQC